MPNTQRRALPSMPRGFCATLSLLALTIVPITGAAWAHTGWQDAAAPAVTATRPFAFGPAGAKWDAGYAAVGPETAYSAQRGYGWVEPQGDLLARDRGATVDALHRYFVVGKSLHTFRIDGLKPGKYLLTVVSGDLTFGDHATEIRVGDAKPFPTLRPGRAQFATLSATVDMLGGTLALKMGNPDGATGNWVVNAITLTPADADVPATISLTALAPPAAASTWQDVAKWPDPTADLLSRFRQTAKNAPSIAPTGLTRADYLKLISGEVNFWKAHQNADGAIIDPYRKVEFQYSTPAFAHAAAALVVYAGRKDLLEAAAKALDWSAHTLSTRTAATHHEDFFAPMIAHTLPLLKPLVPAARSAVWEADIRRFDPFATYRAAPGGGNWNLVATSGEAHFQQMGLRPKINSFVSNSLAAQGHTFGTPYGLYLEGPMAYDHFPRLWVADMLADGSYDGVYKPQLTEVLRRAAITSLFLQSPWGELPAGGRSAQHQWNEAEQCVTYEIYAAQALAKGDAALAAVFKRAAHLSLSSMRRWVRPSGEMQIVKNWMDPADSFGFEGYSSHSQYNLLPMAMLAIAYEHAATTETVAEAPAPVDVGGYVLPLDSLHKVVANVGGTYIELDTRGDHHYDATGLIRIQYRGISPQLSTSDSILAKSAYHVPATGAPAQTTGVGVSWQTAGGTWRRLGELDAATLTSVTVTDIKQSPDKASFTVRYQGNLGGPTSIEERYVVTRDRVELTTTMDGYSGPLRYVWPVFADDGKRAADIAVTDKTVRVTQDGGKTAQTFTADGATAVRVEPQKYGNHNGWARLGVAEYPAGSGAITLVIAARRK